MGFAAVPAMRSDMAVEIAAVRSLSPSSSPRGVSSPASAALLFEDLNFVADVGGFFEFEIVGGGEHFFLEECGGFR